MFAVPIAVAFRAVSLAAANIALAISAATTVMAFFFFGAR